MKTITLDRAKEISLNWHGGQWSALYQFASSGIFTAENCLHYFREIEDCLHPEYNLYPGELSQKNEKELNSLKKYFLKLAQNNGLPIVFSQHPFYGYQIPVLAESVSDEIAAKVKTPKYLI